MKRTARFSFLLFMLLPAMLRAQALELDPDEQARLAELFAPVLLFHADEKYFPTHPLFSLQSEVKGPGTGLPASRLGTPDSRSAFYRALTIEQKTRIATVFYRAYPSGSSDDPKIVLEYWLYYVRNEYRVRSNILPLWMSGSHPNDLEHIHLVLREESDRYVVDEAYASAHEGKIPANRFGYRSAHDGPTRFLVELGSHAMAPDVDGDGLFTIGKDGASGSKMVWGVRDRGYTWPRYRESYMDSRSNGNAIVLTRQSYRLAPVDSVVESFATLNLTESQRKGAFENQTFWFTRIFGRDNGRSDTLLVPPRTEGERNVVGIRGVSSSERRFLIGTVLNTEQPGLFVGARYSYLNPSVYLPDLMFEVDGILTRNKKYTTTQFLLSYPLDGFTRIMVGKSLVTDSFKFSQRHWDTVGTIEVRLGDMRISASTRSSGPMPGASKEFRLFYAFP